MVRLRVERLSPGSNKKLHAQSIGQFTIKSKISNIAYIVDVPKNLEISAVFNVEDISLYYSPNEIGIDITSPQPTPDMIADDKIEDIIDDQIIFHPDHSEHQYLIKWFGQTNANNTWISEEELRQLAPDLLESYIDSNSLEVNFSQPRENDAGAQLRSRQFNRTRQKQMRYRTG